MTKATPIKTSDPAGATPALDTRVYLDDVCAAFHCASDKLDQLKALFGVLRGAFSVTEPNYQLAQLGFEEAERFTSCLDSMASEIATKGVRS